MHTLDALLADTPDCDETSAGEDGRLWRWLAFAAASALGGSAVPTTMRYDDVVAAVTVSGSDG